MILSKSHKGLMKDLVKMLKGEYIDKVLITIKIISHQLINPKETKNLIN